MDVVKAERQAKLEAIVSILNHMSEKDVKAEVAFDILRAIQNVEVEFEERHHEKTLANREDMPDLFKW